MNNRQQPNMQQRRRQQIIARMPRRARASMMLAESSANLASTFRAKHLPIGRVDRYFYGWMQQLWAYQTSPAFVVTNAARDARKLQAQATGSTNSKPSAKAGRRKQAATRTRTQPDMTTLNTTNNEDIQQWRSHLTKFIRQAREHRRNNNPRYTINLARWVRRPVWTHISQRLLQPEQRTGKGEPTHNKAVAQYLLGPQRPKGSATNHRREPQTAAQTTENRIQEIITAALHDGLINIDEQRAPMHQPSMRILRTAKPDDIAKWRQDLQVLIADARIYRRRYDPNHQVNIRQWVQPAIWEHISEHLVAPENRTTEGTPPNDAAVQTYLMQQPTQREARPSDEDYNHRVQRYIRDHNTPVQRGMTTRKTQRQSMSISTSERSNGPDRVRSEEAASTTDNDDSHRDGPNDEESE